VDPLHGLIERNGRRTRLLHAAAYITTLVLLFTGAWLLAGREGDASVLAGLLGAPDIVIHETAGYLLAGAGVLAIVAGRHATIHFLADSIRFRRDELGWFRRWPGAILSGHFGRHSGHFDPGQRLANLFMVGGLLVLTVSGVALTRVSGGPAFVYLTQIHRWTTFVVTPIIAGHVLIGLGILPGYRGVWRAMHGRGRLDVSVARRLWATWLDDRSGESEERRGTH
jgi:cytochrome b subunit of formate dehydrogenase